MNRYKFDLVATHAIQLVMGIQIANLCITTNHRLAKQKTIQLKIGTCQSISGNHQKNQLSGFTQSIFKETR